MEKTYNLSILFQENEFDVQKGYNRYGTKEAYFSVLYRFTIDSERILRHCIPEENDTITLDIDSLARNVDRLQGMLVNIGAVNLAWKIQSLGHLLEKKRHSEYISGISPVLSEVDMLRKRIINAEKREQEPPRVSEPEQKPGAESAPVTAKRRIKPRRGVFKKLLMLIDNFEFESAIDTARAIMHYSYTPEIDATLITVCKSLSEFNFEKSLDEAQKLFALAIYAEESERPAKKNILAIDDMPDVLRTIKAMLKDRYNVFGMTDYDSALKFLRSNTADLIILDIEMPRLDGFAMMQLFRKLPEYANTPIVFLTSNVSDKNVRKAMTMGARDFIKKPVNLAVLINKLESAIS